MKLRVMLEIDVKQLPKAELRELAEDMFESKAEQNEFVRSNHFEEVSADQVADLLTAIGEGEGDNDFSIGTELFAGSMIYLRFTKVAVKSAEWLKK